jgi:hypothetical protein
MATFGQRLIDSRKDYRVFEDFRSKKYGLGILR